MTDDELKKRLDRIDSNVSASFYALLFVLVVVLVGSLITLWLNIVESLK